MEQVSVDCAQLALRVNVLDKLEQVGIFAPPPKTTSSGFEC